MESQKQGRIVNEMRRVTKIIALASIFSFIISYSSLIFSLQQRLQYLLSMYSHLVDKKFMFLLCNGIVGLILGSFRGNSETLLHGKAINMVEQTRQVRIKEMRETQVKKSVAILEDKSASKVEEDERVALLRGGREEVSKEQEQERVALQRGGREEVSKEEERVAGRREEEDKERVTGGREEGTLVVEDDEAKLVQDLAIFRIVDHDDDEIDDSSSSSEDINKKCEEFIRKMKANIRLESRKMISL